MMGAHSAALELTGALTGALGSAGPSLAAPAQPERSPLADRVALAVEADRRAPCSDEARARWLGVLTLEPEHAAARRALGHRRHGGVWHATYAAYAGAVRAEARERLEARGEVRLGDAWVPWHDAPYLRMGWSRDARGRWLPPGPPDAPLLAGWQRRRGGRLALHSRLPPETADEALRAAARVVDDLQRLLGVEAFEPVDFVLADSLAAYNALAAGDPNAGDPSARKQATELSGASAYHYAYFADAWFAPAAPPALPAFRGTGVGYWDASDERLAPFGPFSARHAAALAWLDSIDPSPGAIAAAATSAAAALDPRDYWPEKRLPRWLHVGAATWAERFFVDLDPHAADPLWARRWALENLRRAGATELRLDEVLACELDGREPERSNRLVQQAGAVVAFVADAVDPGVEAARAALAEALADADAARGPVARRAADGAVREAARALERALRGAEEALIAFVR